MAMKGSITGAMDGIEGDSPYRGQIPAMAPRPVPGRTFLPRRNVHGGVAHGTPGLTTTIKGYTYTLTPRATYEIAGLVVSQHRGDALFNLYHHADPGNIRDVCVVWGEAVTNGSYRRVKFSSGEFTCSYSWSGGLLTPTFRPEKAFEQPPHPGRSGDSQADRNDSGGGPDPMTGLLVDYTVTKDGQHVFTRRTSLTRGDTGNGACEILYVTGLSVVARGDHRQADAARLLWYASLALLVALGGVWVARPPVVE